MSNEQGSISGYPSYKDSGVEWIGQIPEHWEIVRINDIAVQQKIKNIGLKERNLLSLSYGKIKRKDFDTSFGLLPESFETYQIIERGNIILRLTDLQNDKRSLRVGFTPENGIITSAYLCLKILRRVYPNFAYYLLYSYDVAKVFYWFGGGLRQSMKFDDIKIFPFIIPSLSEQKAIADYLDTKSAEIDRKIDLLTKKAKRYEELKTALINETVTRGLDKSVPMKDSGIEWIGEIPEHWKISRIKEVGAIKYGLSQPPKYLEQGLPLIRATNIERGKLVDKGLVFISPDDVPYERNPILKENDILVVRSGAYTADSAIIPQKYNGAIAGFDMVLRPCKIHPKYLSYALLSSYVLKDQLILSSFRAAQPHLNKEQLGTTLIFFPPLSEQKEIADYLDAKSAEIEQIIQTIKTQIEKLKELRKTLINDVVTGKIRVTDININ